MNTEPYECTILDISGLSYADRLTAACLQGLANRQGPCLFLNYGVYDEPEARRTNEDFLPDKIWFEKFRPYVGNQDELNLDYYRSLYEFEIDEAYTLEDAVRNFCPLLKGLVIWDPSFPDTANPALVLAGLEDLLVVTSEQAGWAREAFGLEVKHDLRGRWNDRVSLYEWAYEELSPCCKEGYIACIEPEWHRPEFIDYLVQNRIFTYSLSSSAASRVFRLGQTLLLLLVGGPFGLRNLLFNLRLDGIVRRFGLWLMSTGSPETRLATIFQRAVKSRPYPTIFGWHTRRDDELAFMLLLSANGLRLLPSHLASNFSFHSKLPPKVSFQQEHLQQEDVTLEEKVYITFTLSDGDQLVLMDTAELGNWRREERGKIPFNWETQPLLAEIAPALLGQYYQTRTPNDYLIAGPSGAGYIIPPLNGSLPVYLEETARICKLAGIRLFTPYIGDPPKKILKQYGRSPGDFLGFLGGYAHFGRTPLYLTGGKAFIAYTWPYFKNIWDESGQVLEAVQSQIETPGPLPRFVSAHLFAYKTTLKDVYEFVRGLDPEKVKVVRADEFVLAARKVLEGKGEQ